MTDGINNEGAKTRSLIWCAIVGVTLGAVFSVSILEALILEVPVAMVVGLLFCVPPSRRYRLGGYLPTVGFALATMAFAVALPMKPFDKRIASLTASTVSIGDLVHLELASEPTDPEWAKVRITLPSKQPTRSEIVGCINEQTPLKARVFVCGNGSTLLWGAWHSKIGLSSKSATLAQFKP